MPARASASSFTVNLDDLDDILSSPERPPARSSTQTNARKRQREDEEEENNGGADGNVIAVAKRLAVSKKLSGKQIKELEVFLKESWKVSDGLKKNIQHYVAAACLSVTIQAYRNNQTVTLIMRKIQDMNMELPPNFDHDAAAQATLKNCIGEILTQRRSGMKKAIRASAYEQITNGVWTARQGSDCENVFELTQKLAKGTQCHVMPELCARVAILRRAYKAYYDAMEQDYWGRVDATLQNLREKGKNDKKTISGLVKRILTVDRTDYGVQTGYKMPEHVLPSALQVHMDHRINATGSLEEPEDGDKEQVSGGDPESPAGGGEEETGGNSGGNSPGLGSGGDGDDEDQQ